ncbi:ComEC/Rec2 family competence protein [Flavobacterium sp. GT3R68]|uniref:ComEC/Rec2 family competence protein n=1 Tax=Flavobacterium sp. GT3R68 TaxID=2594437 RepID=UPI000F87C695|nr:ComEC/Rec2 family competence protein [Flavobacterium sp. GT3R68]RTY92442.1 ComEC family competence protein [Flavobacterium sp. GSN2]TRW94067.1 ComEC family competence protein [Flavobacterium sp. GT3R68]
MKVLQFPVARITIWFVLGILISYGTNTVPQAALLLLILSLLGFSLMYYLSQKDFIQKTYFGLSVYFLAFCIGVSTQVAHTDSYQKSNFIYQLDSADKVQVMEVVLREKLKSSVANERFIGIVKKINQHSASGKILLNFHKNKVPIKLPIGSHLQIRGLIYRHRIPLNPNQFDYGRYLTNKSVLAQMYTNYSEVKMCGIDKSIWFYSDYLREKIIANLQKSHFQKEELNVITALILGQQQEISQEILHDYQFAGAIHILSVSGLHIGFIMLFITFLLKPLSKNRLGNSVRLIVILVTLWGFAVIAGLSPSVVRSVTMFSFVAVGMHLKRSTNIFHTLLVSILLILLFQPSFLFDVGFQLSYVALFFILWLQPLLTTLWLPKYKISQYLWDIVTVSFAAQIGAFPLSIYYFHQFPGLFFVTNLIVIPFLSVIMALGVLVMVLALFNYVPEILVKLLEICVSYLNKIIGWVASFEQFIIQDIPFNSYMLISSYFLIITTIIWFKKPNFSKMTWVGIAIILFQICCFGTRWNNQSQKEWIVFNLKKKSLITERNGEEITAFYHSRKRNTFDENWILKPYMVSHFSAIKKFEKMQNTFYFKNKSILILDSLGVFPIEMKPDVLVITQSPKINLERLLQTFKPEIVVVDASNYKTYVSCWKNTCRKEKIPFHDTGEKGFYRLN